MGDIIKKYVIIAILILVNVVLIIMTVNSVSESIKKVWEKQELGQEVVQEEMQEQEQEKNQEDRQEEAIENIGPIVDVQSKLVDGRPTFVIDIEDDKNIRTVRIILNGGEEQVIEVNDKNYHQEIVMGEGENKLIVTATDDDDATKTKKIKFDNM